MPDGGRRAAAPSRFEDYTEQFYATVIISQKKV